MERIGIAVDELAGGRRAMRLALAGDAMLGRGVASAIARTGSRSLVDDDVVEVVREADAFVLNLECCIAERGERWPDPAKPFFFCAPPAATKVLGRLGVDCVTLANNHALDYDSESLLETLEHLRSAGIACVGAGADRVRGARRCCSSAVASTSPWSVAATIRPNTRRVSSRRGSPTDSTGCPARSPRSTPTRCS
jgi:poly-gamma-glutamate synthesis protein (capsule biosynthesis protein)